MLLSGLLAVACIAQPAQGVVLNRYSFNGTDALDSVGGLNGTLVNGAAVTGGNLVLNADATTRYVDLGGAGRMGTEVSTLTNCSFETWVDMTAVAGWQRIFDFGSGTATNMFLSPTTGDNWTRFTEKLNNGAEQQLNANPLTVGTHYLAVTIEQTGVGVATGNLYIDGALVATNTNMALTPSGLGVTTQNWLGRSQYNDPYFRGSINEFRIWSNVLTATEIADHAAAGANQVLGANVQWNGTGNFNDAPGGWTGGVGPGVNDAITVAGGTLTIDTPTTYTGGTTINASATLVVSNDNNLGPSGGIFFNGGTLRTAGTGITSSRAISLRAAGTFDTNGLDSTLSGWLNGTAAFSKIGQGTLTLAGIGSTTGSFFAKSGTVVIPNGASLATGAYVSIGQSSGDNGAMVVSGNGQFTVGGDFNVSDVANTRGVLTIQDTAIVNAATRTAFFGKTTATGIVNIKDSATMTLGTMSVGSYGTAVGIVNQSGGTVGQNGGGDWRIGGQGGAGDANAYGLYNLSGGTFSTGGNNFQIGSYGNGVFNQSGGTVNTGQWAVIGRFAGGYGVLNISNGTFNQTGTGNALIVAEAGTGVINVSDAGLLNVTSTANGLWIGHAGGNGTVNLSGGTISTTFIKGPGASSIFNFNGGTLQARVASGTFMQGLTRANVYSGGAIIDSNGQNITIAQPLLAPTGNGITQIPVTAGGAGYQGEPIVKITGGGGSGATARAILTDGVVTGIAIISPGTGYTSAPTVTLAGGGATTAATLGTISLGANTGGGGLTKKGLGTLTLTGANTYNGPTTINAGTLALGSGGSIAASPMISVGGGATFDVNAVSGGFHLPATQTIAGAGTINGGLTVDAGGTILPGTNGTIGTLTFSNGLTLDAGVLKFDLAAPGANDAISLGGNALTVFNPAELAFNALPGFGDPGVYRLLTFGSTSATSASFIAPPFVNGLRATYTVGATAFDLVLTSASGSEWNLTGGGNWDAAASWSGAVPNASEATANFGTKLTADATVTLNSPITVGTINLDNSAASYTLGAVGGTNTLTLDNGENPAVINMLAGSHGIAAPLALAGPTNVTTAEATQTLTISGAISGPGNLTKQGAGTLRLSGINSYAGGTTLTDGMLLMSGGGTLPGGALTVNAGVLDLNASSQTVGTVTVNGGIVRNGTLSGSSYVVGAGTVNAVLAGSGVVLTKNGESTAILGGQSTFDGGTVMNAGTLALAVSSTGAPGAVSSGPVGKGTLTIAGGTIQTAGGARTVANPVAVAGNFTIDGAADLTLSGAVNLGGGARTITVTNTAATILSGALSNGGLVKAGPGVLQLQGTSDYIGGTTISAGTLAISNDSNLGAPAGVLVLNSGTLQTRGTGLISARSISIGGAAIFDTNGLNSTLSGNIAGGGSLTKIGGGTLTLAGTTAYAGNLTVNAGTLAVNGSTNIGSGNILVANAAGTQARVDLAAGGSLQGNYLLMGNGAGAAGALYQTGGNLTLTGGPHWQNFHVGSANGGYGYYQMSGGTATAKEVAVGFDGSGVFNLTGGTFTPGNYFLIARGDAGTGLGVMNVSGTGVLNAAAMGNAFSVGWSGPLAVLNVSDGGRVDLSGKTLSMNQTAANTGFVDLLPGGTLTVGNIAKVAAGTAIFNFNGGTLQASVDQANFMTGLTGAYVYPGGANVDTNGRNVTIAQPLLAPTDSGVSQIGLLDPGAGYLGEPIVRITDGGGIGATARAIFDPVTGTITGITITNPGTGYFGTPTVTLIGGGATTPAVLSSAVLDVNASGGLTKTGAGTLTLGGANTYTGPTTVTGGTLSLDFNAAGAPATDMILGSSPLNLISGAFQVLGKNEAVSSQDVWDTTISGGTYIKALSGTGAGSVTLALGQLTRNPAATVDFTLPASGAITIASGAGETTHGVMTDAGVAYATVGGTDWAAVTGAGPATVAAVAVYADDDFSAAANNVNVVSSWMEPATFSVNTLRFNNAISTSLWLIGTNTLGTGGLLVSSGVGNNPVEITGGTLRGAAGKELVIHQFNTANVLTVTSTIADNTTATGLIKSGPGVLVLAGYNTYSGLTTLDAGVLSISDDAALGTPPATPAISLVFAGSSTLMASGYFALDANRGVKIASGATATVDTGVFDVAVPGAISGDGRLAKIGAGTLTLGGTNSYLGGTAINAGTLRFESVAAMGGTGPNVTVSAGAVAAAGFAIDQSFVSRIAPTSAGVIALAVDSGNNLDLSSTGANLVAASLGAVDDVTFSGTLTPGANTFRLGGGGGTLTVSGNLAGVNSLVANGPGTVVLAGDNTFTGSTTINAGAVLAIDDDSRLGNPANGIIFNGGTLRTVNSGITSARAIAMAAAGTVDTNELDSTLSGPITGNGSLNKTGQGTLALSGTSVFGSPLLIHQGAIAVPAGGSVTVNNWMAIGNVPGDQGTMKLSGNAQLTVTGDFNVSDQSGSIGTLTIEDTAIATVRGMWVGKTGNAIGVVRQTGGTLQQAGAISDWRIGGNASAADSASYGYYGISAGTLNTGTCNFQIGSYGYGILDQTGGTVISGQWPVIGRWTGGRGVYDISGGTFQQTGTGNRLLVAEAGNGTLNVSGTGVVDLAGGLLIGNFNEGSPGTGVVNLRSGGTIITPFVSDNNVLGNSALNFHGGTLKPKANNDGFLQGIDGAYVYEGGAVIDTDGKDIRINQPLLAPTGLGVVSIPVDDGGAGYLAPPMVVITPDWLDTGASGATANAVIDENGTVTGITITNPGRGFTVPPTVTLAGGGSFSAIVGIPELQDNISGGLVKKGAGRLTLAGANTYGGGTTVEGGELLIAAADALPAGGALTIGADGVLVLGQGLSAAAGSVAASSAAPAAVPEPGTLALLAVAAVLLLAARRRK